MPPSALRAPAAAGASLVFFHNQQITRLAKSGRLDEAVSVFNSMPRRNTVSYNSMISALAKGNRVADARQVFDGMPARNLVSWNAMLAGYAHNDCAREASDLFGRMPERDVFSWTIMVTCLGRAGRLEDARRLFDVVPGEKTLACYNAMVNGYAKNGFFDEARLLLGEMPVRDMVSWNSILAGYTQNGEVRRGLEFFECMPERDVVSWNLVLDGLVRSGDLDSAVEFYERIPCPNVVTEGTMLNGYARSGRMGDAKDLFGRMAEKNVVSWNVMIAGYVQELMIEDAYQLFREMPERNSVSWTTIIDGHVRVGKLKEARDLLEKMPHDNGAAQTAMLHGYVQVQNMDEARQLFEKIKYPDVRCWNTMISGYTRCGRMDDALGLFHCMPKKDVVSWNTMIAGYAQNGQMQDALRMFKDMSQRNSVSWNSVICGLVQNGFYIDAFLHLVSMKKDMKKPDWSTLACCICACGQLASLPAGEQLHALLLRNGFLNDLSASNALITMYSKCGSMSRAEQVLNEMSEVDIVSRNSLISGYALNGHGREAIGHFEKMIEEGLHLDQVTFVAALSACSHAGMVDEGIKIFNSLIGGNYDVEIVAEHYACMVDLLGRSGRLGEAYELILKMPVKQNAGIWGALLGACRIHRKLKLGKIAAQKLFQCEPHKSSNYLLLSNMHAEACRWDEVQRMRVSMKERGIEKVQPGCSWIEIKNQMLAFVADDLAQPRISEICPLLQSLTTEMRKFDERLDSFSFTFDCG